MTINIRFKSHTCPKSLFYCKHQASSSQSQKEGVFTKHAICGEILVVEIDNEFLWLEAKLLIENLAEEMSVYKGSTHNIHFFFTMALLFADTCRVISLEMAVWNK